MNGNASRIGMPVGRIQGVTLFVGWSYLGLCGLLFLSAVILKDRPGNADLPAVALVVLATIAVVGMFQEMAHALAAWSFHGRPGWVKIAAHGGAGRYQVFGGMKQALVAGAGPGISFALATALASVLAWQYGIPLSDSLDPFKAPDLDGALNFVNLARTAAWISMLLTLVQCLPLWQCDGRAVIDGLVVACHDWRRHHRRADALSSKQLHEISATIIAGIAIALFGLALVVAMVENRVGTPRWPVLAAAGLLCWISSRKNDPRIDLIDDRERPIGWLGMRRIRAAHRRERREAIDMQQLDAILDLLNEKGINGLNAQQRATLKRASDLLQQQQAAQRQRVPSHDDKPSG